MVDNVTIHSSYTIIPSQPTPTPILASSSCEQIKLSTHAPLLYVYKSPHHHHNANIIHTTLHSSLSQILVPYYPLAGRLCWAQSHGGRWELHCNSKGAHLLEANSDLTLDDLGDFVPTHTLQYLIPNIDYTLPIQHVPLLAIQLTRFSCGGLTLGVAMCRAVIDGTAAMRFVNSWAKLARGDLLLPIELPVHDRTLMDSYRLHTAPRFDHSEFHPPPLWLGRFESSDDTKAVVAVLKLTTDQVNILKKKATMSAAALGSPKRAYTSFEVIAGHVWRCVSKARYDGNNKEQPTRLSTLANCRNRLEPPLPSGYAGNAAFPTVTRTCSFQDVTQKPLSYAVGNVREALERVRDEYVRSAMDYIGNNIDDDDEKGMKMMRYNFHYPARSVLEFGGEVYKGNSNLFVVSWMNFGYREADFGWGKPFYFGPGFMDSEGKAFVMNGADGDGVRLAISLLPKHMDAFNTFFYQDIHHHLFSLSKL